MNSLNGSVIRVLITEDEPAIRRALSSILPGFGLLVGEASCGEDALILLRAQSFDAVLLDVKMPGIGGIETLRRIRSFAPWLPVLMLTVCNSEDEKVEAFDLGADDYITKPFHIRELICRIRATVRLARAPGNADGLPIEIGDIYLEPTSRTATKRNDPVHLTPKEFEILYCLMNRANEVVTHEQLLTQVWGAEYCEQIEYLRTFIRQLRSKIEDDHSKPRYLLTVSHIGYRFADVSRVGSRPKTELSRISA